MPAYPTDAVRDSAASSHGKRGWDAAGNMFSSKKREDGTLNLSPENNTRKTGGFLMLLSKPARDLQGTCKGTLAGQPARALQVCKPARGNLQGLQGPLQVPFGCFAKP